RRAWSGSGPRHPCHCHSWPRRWRCCSAAHNSTIGGIFPGGPLAVALLIWLLQGGLNRQRVRGRLGEEVKAGAESQVISEEQLRKAEEYVQQEEGAANRLAGWVGVAVTGIAVAMTLFHLYAAYDIVPTQELRYIHVAFVLLLSFLLFPLAAR